MTPADQHALREALAENERLRLEIELLGQENENLEQEAEDAVAFEARALAAEAENTRLKETVEAARAALKPFAEEAAIYDPDDGDGGAILWAGIRLRIKHLRAARSVLATIPPKENTDA